MTDMSQTQAVELANTPLKKLVNWAAVAAFVYLILVAVGTVSSGFKLVSGGTEGAAQIFAFANNPFMALFLGLLATSLVQSSSTVTSVIVGLVAGGLPLEIAIPMVMGANMGTTITNTFVSIGHIGRGEEFKRAFAAATVHDFFNVLAVAIFLPLEMMFGLLEKMATSMAHLFEGAADLSIKHLNFMKPLTKPGVGVVKDISTSVAANYAGYLMIALGIVLIIVSVTMLSKVLKQVMVGRAKDALHTAVGRGPVAGITSGTIVTVMVQSSSTTTSLIVPLAGAGVFNLRQVFPFTLGANIGTTVTALLAATALSGSGAEAGLIIALVHLMFNLCSVVLIYGVPQLREIPLRAATWLAEVGSKDKKIAFGYVAGLFFVTPGLLMMAVS